MIGDVTLQKIGEVLARATKSSKSEINAGWLHAGEDDFDISYKVSLTAGKVPGDVKIYEDTFSDSVNEKQTNIFEQEENIIPCPLHPDIDGVFESICDKCPKRFKLVFVSGDELPKVLTQDEAQNVLPLQDGQMLQPYSCRSWDDYDYKQWCEFMINEEIEPKPEKKSKKKNKK